MNTLKILDFISDSSVVPAAQDKLKKLYIEPTSNCNLNCKMCFRNTWVNEPLADMDMSIFQAILRTMPESVETVFFGGMGEPMIHPEIITMVKAVVAKGKRVELLTNAALLTPERSQELVEAGISMIWVSIDSFNEQGYEAIRRKSDFALVQSHLIALNRARGVWENRKLNEYMKIDSGKEEIRLGINFVIMKSNVTQLANIPDFIKRYMVNEVNISNMIPSDEESVSQVLYDKVLDWDMGTQDKSAATVNMPLINWREKEVMDGLRGLLSTSVAVSLSGQPITRKSRYCRFVEEGNAFVKHNGNISPCMALLHSATTFWSNQKRTVHHHSFGNVTEEGLEATWNSKEYQSFRDRVKRFDFSPCIRCSTCEMSEENLTDCFGNPNPTCGACLWAEGIISCP